MPVGSFLRHAQVGGIAGRVQQRNALGADLRNPPGCLAYPSHQERALAVEIGLLLLGEVVGVDHRIVQQAPRERVPRAASACFGCVGYRLVFQCLDTLFKVARQDERGAARGDQQAGQGATVHVI